MAKPKVVLNHKGVSQIARSQWAVDQVKKRADDIAERANSTTRDGEGYETDTYVGKNRARASVRTETPYAVRHNLKYNTLLRVLGEVSE